MADTLHRRRFDKKANDIYTYEEPDALMDDSDAILRMVQNHHDIQRPRLEVLDDYYKGDNVTILKESHRRRDKDKSDHRATHNFAKYVSQFIQGYLAGKGITVQHRKKAVQKKIDEVNELNEVNALNSELVLDSSIYGRAYELVYRNEADETKVVLSSPLNTFVIYDDTVEQKPIAGVRYRKIKRNNMDVLKVTLYTDEMQLEFESEHSMVKLELKDMQDHYLGGVPIVEYSNNRQRLGDYENVLNLIDLYDEAQSDIANYMTDLNDALLAVIGDADMTVDEAKKMKDANMILVKPGTTPDGKAGQVDVKYIYKQYDVAGVESYKDRLERDIHKFTNTPDLTYAGGKKSSDAESGEAIKEKLFGLEQVRATKERLFKRGLRTRYRLCGNVMRVASELTENISKLEIQFKPNLPRSLKQEIENFLALGGELPEELILTLIPSLVEDPEKIKKMLQEERKQRMQDYPNEDFTEKEKPSDTAGRDAQ